MGNKCRFGVKVRVPSDEGFFSLRKQSLKVPERPSLVHHVSAVFKAVLLRLQKKSPVSVRHREANFHLNEE
jgi:hypothetical protein